MKCESCDRDFPSVYYFKAKGICNECYEKLDQQQKDETEPLYQPIPKIPKPKGAKLTGFLKGITTFALAVLVLGVIGITMGLVAGMIDPGIYRYDSFKDFGILYEVGSESWQISPNYAGLSDIGLTNVAAMEFTLTSRTNILLYFLSKYLIIAFTLIIFYKMRQILISLEQGKPFVQENAHRIRWIGCSVIGIGVAAMLFGGLILLFLNDPFRITGVEVKVYWLSVVRNAGDDIGSIFWGLLVLLISEIFRQAVRLKEEQELTV